MKRDVLFDKRYIPIFIIIITGFLLSLGAFFIVRNQGQEKFEAQFNLESQNLINAIQRELAVNLETLEGLYSFYKGSQEVTREEFRKFTQAILLKHQSIQAMEWVPKVPHAKRSDFEMSARLDGHTGFEFTDREEQGIMRKAPARKVYFPVYYVEPYRGNETVLGFDLASDPVRYDAMMKSCDTGEIVATDRITLIQENRERHGFLVFNPVYKKNIVLNSIEQRRKNLVGFVLGFFRIGEIVENALRYIKGGEIDIHLFDKNAAPERQFLYTHFSRLRNNTEPSTDILSGQEEKLRLKRTFSVGDRKWMAVTRPTPDYFKKINKWHPIGAFSSFFLMTVLITIYMKNNLKNIIRFEDLTGRLSKEINERKKTEEALKESEELYRTSINNANDGFAFSENGRLLHFNKRFLEIFGYEESEDVEGKLIATFVHPDDRERVSNVYDRKAKGLPVPSRYEFKGIKKDGGSVFIEISSALITYHGKAVNLAFLRDVTYRKLSEKFLIESEEKYSNLYRYSSDAIILHDLDGNIMDVNEKSLNLFGYSKNEILNMKIQQFYPEGALETFKEAINEIAEKGFVHFEIEFRKRDGEIFSGDVSSSILHMGERRIVQGIVRDVTDRRVHEQEREKLLSELKSKNRELEQVLYVTSHDLRSPLVNIEGFGSELSYSVRDLMTVLKVHGISKEIKEKISPIVNNDIPESLLYIQKGIDKMDVLLKGLLRLSRLGRIELKKEEIDMNQLMQDIIGNYQFMIQNTGLKIEADQMPECYGDTEQMNQVFSNLLDNAIKYRDGARTGIIEVTGYRNGKSSVYCVKDNGIGVEDVHREKIFEIFHQLEPDRVKGEGLGLTIVQRIVERHGGKVWLESEPGKGSRFYVELPAGKAG